MYIPTAEVRLRIFGSRASGDNRPNSDIDVLVEGPEAEVQSIKESLHYYSIEQGGPLDLFVLGSVDNEIDLVAAYASPVDPRTVCVGDQDDLDEVLSNAYDVKLQDLIDLCVEIDKLWNEGTSVDRVADKVKKSKPAL